MASTLPTVADCCDPCIGIDTVTVTGTVGWFVVDDIAALRPIAASTINRFAIVGTFAAFIGVFRWDNVSVDVDDGITVVNPTGNVAAGRWVRLI